MARDDAPPDNLAAVSGQLLYWQLTLPGISDRFWRAMGPNQVRWLVTRQTDGGWRVSRYPSSAPNPERVGESDTLEAGEQLAEELARAEATT